MKITNTTQENGKTIYTVKLEPVRIPLLEAIVRSIDRMTPEEYENFHRRVKTQYEASMEQCHKYIRSASGVLTEPIIKGNGKSYVWAGGLNSK